MERYDQRDIKGLFVNDLQVRDGIEVIARVELVRVPSRVASTEAAIEKPTHPPDTGGIIATSSPPLRITESGRSINSASTLHRLCSRTRSIPVFGCRRVMSPARSESFNPSSGRTKGSEVSLRAVVAAAK